MGIPCVVCEKGKWEFRYEGQTLHLPSMDARKYARSGYPHFIGSLHLFAVSREVSDWIQEVGFTGLKLHRLEIKIESGEISQEEYFIVEPTCPLNIEIRDEDFEICSGCGVATQKGYGVPKSGLMGRVCPGEEFLDFYKCTHVFPNAAVIGESAYDAMLEKWTKNKRSPKRRPLVTAIYGD